MYPSEIKISTIVNFSSQSQKNPAKNLLLDNEDLSWKCEKWTEYSWIILELSQISVIDSIKIINSSSAFIEVFTSDNFASGYRVLLPVEVAQLPEESKQNKNCHNKLSFSNRQFTAAKSEPCKFIKIVCSQPYNKKTFGLSSVKIYGESYKNTKEPETYESLVKKYKLIEKNEIKPPRVTCLLEDSKITANNIKTEDKDEISSIIKRKNSITNDDAGQKKKKELNKLMSDVVFALSGMNKDSKKKIKEMACALGAKYESVWNSKCTHLICTDNSASKFKEAYCLGGRIVSINWIQHSFQQQKCLPWQKYSLIGCVEKNEKSKNEKPLASDNSIKKTNDDDNVSDKNQSKKKCPAYEYDSDIIYDLDTNDEGDE